MGMKRKMKLKTKFAPPVAWPFVKWNRTEAGKEQVGAVSNLQRFGDLGSLKFVLPKICPDDCTSSNLRFPEGRRLEEGYLP